MKLIFRKANTLFHLGREVLFLLPQTFLVLSFAHLALHFFAFKKIQKLFSKKKYKALDEKKQTKAKQIGYATKVIGKNVPWDAACYTQALTAKILLDWNQIDSTTYLGVWKDEEENTMKGHAWVKVGNLFITGRKGHKKYKVLAQY